MSDTEKSASSNNKFLKGTLILTVSSIVVKVIGSLNWIILSRVLGGEGIGLYQMGFPIYLMAITLSSAGIPVAISIITAEKLAQKDFLGAKRVFNVSLRLLFVTGLVFASALFFGAHWLIDNHWIRDSRAYYSIIALAPAVFFVTFLASFRGYLQGWQIMTPTAALTERAGVSRMTYYRNYHSLDEIFSSYLKDLVESYRQDVATWPDKGNYNDSRNMLHCYEYFNHYKEFIACLVQTGLGHLLLQALDGYILDTYYTEDKGQDFYYTLRAFSGSLYNIYVTWILEDSKESAEEIVSIICKIYS